jgi:hypothetical protein
VLSYATKVETHKRERCEVQDQGRMNTAKRTRFNPPLATKVETHKPCPTAPRKALRPPPIIIVPEEPTPMDWVLSYATKVETHKRERCEVQDQGRMNTAKRTRFNPPLGMVQELYANLTMEVEVEPTFPVEEEDYVTLDEGAPSTTFLRSRKGRVPLPRRSIRLATNTKLGSIYAPSGRRRSARVLARFVTT